MGSSCGKGQRAWAARLGALVDSEMRDASSDDGQWSGVRRGRKKKAASAWARCSGCFSRAAGERREQRVAVTCLRRVAHGTVRLGMRGGELRARERQRAAAVCAVRIVTARLLAVDAAAE